MQRFQPLFNQFVKSFMNKLLATLVLMSIFFSCKKDAPIIINGTVISMNNGIALVTVENPDAKKHSFICNPGITVPAETLNSCTKNIFILNLPQALQAEGKKIQFSKFEDKGQRLIWSVAYAAHDVLVYDAKEQ